MSSFSLCSYFRRGSCSEHRTNCSAQMSPYIYAGEKASGNNFSRSLSFYLVGWMNNGAFRVKMNSDNSEIFSQEMSHREHTVAFGLEKLSRGIL